MSLADIKNLLIPQIAQYTGTLIFGADQPGDKPNGSYATFKITSPYIKGVGQNNEYVHSTTTGEYQLTQENEYKFVISFTAYDLDEDISFDLAQQIYDWFAFFGQDWLYNNDMVIKDMAAVQNRDILILDGYERRNGFDVTLATTRILATEIDIIEHVEINQ